MKARVAKNYCLLETGEYYVLPVLTDQGQEVTLRLSDYEYTRLNRELTGKDEPPQNSPEMEAWFQGLADQINHEEAA
ncbi:MAG: hypothetical protein RBS34_15405 [Desulfofustis sp.]|jgi:hypothetical protein|nr:hypothetical protein [Desulfofustis sp.]